MAKPNLIGGTVTLKIDGVTHATRGNFSYNLGKPTRTSVFDGNACVGYTEAPQEPMFEGEMTVLADLDVADLVVKDGITAQLDLENGVTVVFRDAWYSGEGTVNANEGMMPVKFTGRSAEQVR